MFKNYFITAIRHITRNKFYTGINTIGLAVSLTACVLITLYVQDELSYDQHWQSADQIYRTNLVTKRAGRAPQEYPAGSMLMLPAMRQFFPDEIELGTRVYRAGPQEVVVDDARYPDPIYFAGEEVADLFQFEVLDGNLGNVFLDINSIALGEEAAIKYFGNRNPVGETISGVRSDGELEEYEVVAVYRLAEGNTVLELPTLALYNEEKVLGEDGYFASWLRVAVQTFVRFKPGTDIESVQSRMAQFLDQHASLPASRIEARQTPSDVLGIQLQSIGDIYFNPVAFINFDQNSGNRTTVWVFMAISMVVVLIGCINFVVLATAMTTRRGLETGMRKMFGASPGQLVRQYLAESLLITLAAFILALLAVEFLLPSFQDLVGKSLSMPYLEAGTWLYLLALFLATGLLGGLYPALLLSNSPPVKALRTNYSSKPNSAFQLRNLLSIFQFTVSISLIIATVVVYGQLSYTSRLNPGFNPENLLLVSGFGRNEISPYRETFKQEVLNLAEVSSAGFASARPNSGLGLILDYNAGADSAGNQEVAISTLFIGYDFFQTYEIPLLAGRYPELGRDPGQQLLFMLAVAGQDTEGMAEQPARILLNASATRRLGFSSAEDAVGRIIESGEPGVAGYQEFEIIGVVRDSQYKNLRSIPEPEIYYVRQDNTNFMALRYEANPQLVRQRVEAVWQDLIGNEPFVGVFVNQDLANAFSREQTEAKVLVTFSLLAIVIACLGLFGIATFSVERRTREVGLRKVMGAETRDIISMLLWHFSKPVLIANLLAWPLAVWIMLNWLQRFPYQLNSWLLGPLCVAAGLAALAIAWFTVITNVRRIAVSNPMEALRCE